MDNEAKDEVWILKVPVSVASRWDATSIDSDIGKLTISESEFEEGFFLGSITLSNKTLRCKEKGDKPLNKTQYLNINKPSAGTFVLTENQSGQPKMAKVARVIEMIPQDKKKKKEQMLKRERSPKEQVEEKLRTLYQKFKFYQFKDLQNLTEEPMHHLKEILKHKNSKYTFHSRGPHKNYWGLKELAEDSHVEEDQDQ